MVIFLFYLPRHSLCSFEMSEAYAQPDGRPILSTGFLPDGRVLVATKHGDVTLLVETDVSGVYDSELYLSLRADAPNGHPLGIENGKEAGLLTMVVDPEFARTGAIYLYGLPTLSFKRYNSVQRERS